MKKICTFLILLTFVLPVPSDARHYRSDWNIDRDDLDGNEVEEFAVPVLFDYDELFENYGDPRGGGTRAHEGQDIIAVQGAPIVSPTEAIVIRTGEGESAGKYVYTANPGGETFRYMHLDDIAAIESGDELEVGDFIGTVGDTGNAPDEVYHLHLEVRDEDNEATDPFPRLTKSFTLQEEISFLENIIDRYDGDEEEYAEFLVDTFTDDLTASLRAGYDMPKEIIEALEDKGIVTAAKAEDRLEDTLEQIPEALALELGVGDENVLVMLLQVYLIYTTEGPARDTLMAAGPTGYYGNITAAAITAFQREAEITVTGQYDNQTRAEMQDTEVTLQLD